MIVCKFCTNLTLSRTTYADDDKDPLLNWGGRRVEGEHRGKSLTNLSTSSIERTDTWYLPSNSGSMVIYERCTDRDCTSGLTSIYTTYILSPALDNPLLHSISIFQTHIFQHKVPSEQPHLKLLPFLLNSYPVLTFRVGGLLFSTPIKAHQLPRITIQQRRRPQPRSHLFQQGRRQKDEIKHG